MPVFPGWRLSVAGTLLGCAYAVAAAGSASDQVRDYSHAMTVAVSGQQGVVQLRLPREIYLASRSRELADLRLFDATGAALPFALTDMARPERERRVSSPAALFSIRGAQSGRTWADNVSIETSENGVVTSVSLRDPARHEGGAISGVILDLYPNGVENGVAGAIDAVTLTPPSDLGNYSARILLESSDDLQEWEPLAEGALSWLVNDQGQSVRQDRIAFAPRPFRYARMRWLEGKPVTFLGAAATHVLQREKAMPPDVLVVQAQRAASGRDLVYPVSVALPVETVGLVLEGTNAVFPANIGFYETQRARNGQGAVAQFRSVAAATFFQLSQDGRRRVSGDVPVAPTHAAQWIVRPRQDTAQMPSLRLGWRPASLVFVAAGRGPYTVAVGRDGVDADRVPLLQVAPGFSAAELASLEQAVAGPVVRQQAAGRPDAGGPAVGSHGVLWLWGLLIVGVAMLGAMAWRLSQQLKHGPTVDKHEG